MTRVLAAAAFVAAAVIAAGCGAPAVPPDIVVEDVVEDLMLRAPDTATPVELASLDPGEALRGDGARTSLLAAPGSSFVWRVAVPPDAALRFGLGVHGAKRRDDRHAGLVFTVTVDGEPLFARTVNPSAHRDHRRWWDERVSLAAAAGRTVEIVARVAADASDRPLAGRAGWSRLRIVRETRVPRRLADDGSPNLLVVVVDTLRADAVGCHGASPSPTPNLDRLAAGGLVFDTAVAQSSWTLPSVASLLSGLPPRQHGAIGQRERNDDGRHGDARWGFLPDAVETWPEAAARAGLTTFGASANPLVSRGTNLAQGFETFVELPWDPAGRNWASADTVHAAFRDWLARHRQVRFAAYLHVMEPHDPYTPPSPPTPPPGIRPALAAGWIRDAANTINGSAGPPVTAEEIAYLRRCYVGEVAAWDRAFGALLDHLREQGLLDRTVVVVTADHGEEFQEHGRLTHGSHLYDESVRVPLVIAGPGIPIGRRADLAQGIDLAPTARRILGLPTNPRQRGRDLLAGGASPDAILETASGIAPDGSPEELTALRTIGWKLIETAARRRTEVYDLTADPGERHDLDGATAEAASLARALAQWRDATPREDGPLRGPDPAFADKLRALGYAR